MVGLHFLPLDLHRRQVDGDVHSYRRRSSLDGCHASSHCLGTDWSPVLRLGQIGRVSSLVNCLATRAVCEGWFSVLIS